MSKTIRLNIPDWQSGNNPVYYFGAELLNWLAPTNQNQKSITVEVKKPTKKTHWASKTALWDKIKSSTM